MFSLRDFDYHRHQGTFWKYIQGLALTGTFLKGDAAGRVLITQPWLTRAPRVSLASPIRSKPAEINEAVSYDITVQNETHRESRVSLVLADTAWEACPAELSQSQLVLPPRSSKTVRLSVTMNDRVAPGGRESRTVTAIADGRGDLKQDLRFTTLRRLAHPYLMHTQAGWQAVMEKADRVDWARDARARYIEEAHAWQPPTIRSDEYNYPNREANRLLECAVAWKLSGDEALADKALGFLRAFSDPEKGYPVTRRCNNGAHVHRGMFFLRVAQTYDLLFDHPGLTDDDHARIDHTFRLYRDWVDYMILTGDGNNHQAGLVAGALTTALVTQDFEEVDRFLHGTAGYRDLLAAGVLDDGHYFEGTANYNILTANIFNSVVVAFEPWGIDLKNWKVPARYGKFIMVSDWAMRGDFLGMSFERSGPATRTTRQLKDLWDAVLPMSDYRGVVFPTADSVAIDLTYAGNNEGGFGFDMAYYLWRDPSYIPLLNLISQRDLIYGVPDLPDLPFNLGRASYVSDNVGFAVLRSRSEGRDDRERYQAVQRYGTHGGYHGHFDKTSLVSLSRFGRTHYGTEASWYGYWSLMFKMWVQSSSSHNMVVVDHRMQRPVDNRRLLFHSGDLMQVSATEIETDWIDPPYGGQTPYALKMPEEKSWQEGRWLPTPDHPRPQGDTGTPTEPILQRRLMIVTDDYVVLSDFVKGSQTHDFDNLFNAKGLIELAGEQKTFSHQVAQCDPNPYSAAQFITDCDWYDTQGTVKAGFVLDWSKGDMGGRQSHSEPGGMNVDYYSAWPRKAEVMVGNYPESLNVARQLSYRVLGDGRLLDEGQIAPWILGQVDLDLDVRGIKTLEIETTLKKARELKTIFLGNPRLLNADGDKIPLDGSSYEVHNIAAAAGPNQDYAGGKVTIFGQSYPRSIAAEPDDRDQPGKLVFDLTGQNAARFRATLGGDYPVGGDDIQRKIIATRSTGETARFLSVVEFHEDHPIVKSVVARSANELVVERTDGGTDTFEISGLEGDGNAVSVKMTSAKDGEVIQTEETRSE